MEITNSEVSTFRSCVRKWYYNYILQFKPSKASLPLYIGDVIHQALELFWNGRELTIILDFVDHFCDDNPPPKDEETTITHIKVMLIGYFAKWAEDRKNWDVIEVEKMVGFDFGGFKYRGKVDVVARYKPDNRVYIIEHKTASDDIGSTSDFYWQRLEVDNQITGYQRAVIGELGGDVGIIYDVLKKPTTKGPKLLKSVRQKKNETDEEFEERKMQNRFENTESYPAYFERIQKDYSENLDSHFVRRTVYRNESQREEWESEINQTYKFMKITLANQCFPKNDSMCKGRYGVCEFFPVCAGMDDIESENYRKKEAKHEELDA